MLAVRLSDFGGPSVLRLEEVPDPEVRETEVGIEVEAAGVNFGDLLVRRGDYFGRKALPVIPGWEVIGKVTVADDQGNFETGQRVAALLSGGGYAQRVAAPVKDTVAVPESITDQVALAMVIQGATAWRLLETLREGERVLVSGAGSGVSHLVVQLARHRLAGKVLVVSSDEEKASIIRELGGEAFVPVSGDDLAEQIGDRLGGEKVDLVIDMIGGEIFDGMIRNLRPGGRAIVYGVAGGKATKIGTGSLLKNGWTVSGLWLGHEGSSPFPEVLGQLFELCEAGVLKPTLGPVFSLEEAADAHRAVESRTAVGKVMLDCRLV